MLHFLIGVAVLLWIVVTLTHFIRGERERRLIAKHLAPPKPKLAPLKPRGALHYVTYTVAACVVGFIILVASH